MFVATRTKNPGEGLGGGTAAVATLFVMDYVQFRFVGGPNAVAAPICEMIHYGLASARAEEKIRESNLDSFCHSERSEDAVVACGAKTAY